MIEENKEKDVTNKAKNKKGKGQISAVVVVAIVVVSTVIVINTINPFVEDAQASQAFIEAKNVLASIDQVIQQLSVEAIGGRRQVDVDLREGRFIVAGDEDRLKIRLPGSIDVGPGRVAEEGNIKISGGGLLTAKEEDIDSDGNTDLVLRNTAMMFAVEKIGNSTTPANWWSTAWGARRKITFDNSNSSEALVDFPVLVPLDSTTINYSKTRDSGQDIRFVDADNSTELSYEIELWNESGTSTVWVKVPQIDASSTSDYIWMYYDNAAASDAQNAGGVWTNNFSGVWHLSEDPSGTAPQMKDSTSNGNNGTSNGSMTASDQVPGQVDGSLDFDGVDDYVDVGSNILFNSSSVVTMTAWANSVTLTNSYPFVMRQSADANEFEIGLGQNQGLNTWRFEVCKSSVGCDTAESVTGIQTGQWVHLVGIFNTNDIILYLNGELEKNISYTRGSVPSGNNMHIGNSGTSNLFNGTIDEVRISSVSRSSGWINASFSSTNGSFTTFGSEEGGPWASLNTSTMITAIENSRTGTNITPASGIFVNDWTNTSAGTGYTKLTQTGPNIESSSILVFVNSSSGISYEALFTLRAGWDFVEMSVKNLTGV